MGATMKIYHIGVYLLLALLAGNALADNTDPIVEARVISSVDKLQPGSSARLAVRLTIHHPWHINANPAADEFLIPTEIQFTAPQGVAMGKVEYPAPEEKRFSFSETVLWVYEGDVYVYTSVSVPPDYSAKNLELNGKVTFQACNDQMCLPPESAVFNETLLVAAPGETVREINQPVFGGGSTLPPAGGNLQQSDLARTIESKGLFVAFLTIFIAGLALNLTPCVYPLIPITVSYFGGQTGNKSGNLLLLSIIYVLGMAITYSILGAFAALTGSILGAWLQNPYVLVGIAAVMVALAMAMFGLFEIRVPTALAGFAGKSQQGYWGTLLMGLTVGIIAAPCIGPFVLALLIYVGERGDPLMGFLMFFVLALGLGVPFIFLALFGGAINKLPRAGNWMVWVKKVFGFLLIGMAFYFIEPLFASDLWYFTLLAVTALLAGIYLAWIDPTEGQTAVFSLVKNLIGLAFVAAGVFFWVSSVEAYVDQRLETAGNVTGENAVAFDKISWGAYSGDQLQAAIAEQRPVIIDFFADWCIPCKELDKFTFTDSRVIELSRQFTMLKADLTKQQDPAVQALQKRYRIRGVPTVVFLGPGGEELSAVRVVSYVNADDFLNRMQKAAGLAPSSAAALSR